MYFKINLILTTIHQIIKNRVIINNRLYSKQNKVGTQNKNHQNKIRNELIASSRGPYRLTAEHQETRTWSIACLNRLADQQVPLLLAINPANNITLSKYYIFTFLTKNLS